MLKTQIDMNTEVHRRLFTVDEYYRMGRAGIFNDNPRVELIEGEIIEMAPLGNRHLACVNRATELFVTAFAGRAVLSPQNPVRLSEMTEPMPDVVLLKPRSDFYRNKRIWGDDTYLVVEVAETTLAYDRERKLPLYAKSGVREVWIEDLQHDRLLVYRDPAGDQYSTCLELKPDESVSIAAFPETVFSVADLLLSYFDGGLL